MTILEHCLTKINGSGVDALEILNLPQHTPVNKERLDPSLVGLNQTWPNLERRTYEATKPRWGEQIRLPLGGMGAKIFILFFLK